MAHDVLIIAADAAESRRLQEILTGLELNSRTMPGGAAAIGDIGSGANAPALIVLDLRMPDMDGLAVLRHLRELLNVPIIALSDTDSVEEAQAAIAAGASDIIATPAAADRIEAAVRSGLKISALEGEIARIRRKLDGRPEFTDIVAGTAEMQRAVALGKRAADIELPILIEGEPGTGKELMARAIYGASARSAGDFHMMHCAQLRGDGETGAATDCTPAQIWAKAEGGVLFLEEISELSLPAQTALAALLATETGFVRDGRPRVRLICTSSRNLIERVKRGQFREDLYYRINVFPVWLPPLRDRADDVPALSRHFLTQVIAEEGKRIDTIDDAAMALLTAYIWPGNVLQLEKAIFRAVILAEGDRLGVQEFPQIAAQLPGFNTGASPGSPPAAVKPLFEGPAMLGGTWPITRAIAIAPNEATLGIPALTEEGEIRRLDDIEADMIRLALGHYRGHITEVARRLGIGRSTLYRKMREFGLEVRHI